MGISAIQNFVCGLCIHGDDIGGGGVLGDHVLSSPAVHFGHPFCISCSHSSCISRFSIIRNFIIKHHLNSPGSRPMEQFHPGLPGGLISLLGLLTGA